MIFSLSILSRRRNQELDYAAFARAACERTPTQNGADGVLVLSAATNPAADATLRIFNADGSSAEMCGNGARCAVVHWFRTQSNVEGEMADRQRRALRYLCGNYSRRIIDRGAGRSGRSGRGYAFRAAGHGRAARHVVFARRHRYGNRSGHE